MRTFSFVCLILLNVFVLACSKTAEPDLDNTAPNVVVQLSVYPIATGTPHSYSFYATPRSSSDNNSSVNDLRVRWDLENDGEWDTEFQGLESVADFVPSTLPVDDWFVKCEMRDLAGNSVIHTESLLLPEWLPVPPDIIAGEIYLSEVSSRAALGDTLQLGASFNISLPRQDWLNEENLHVTQRYYIDDLLVGEDYSSTYFPNPNWHRLPRILEYEGFQFLGVHEIRVELELSGELTESNGENNSASRMVYVVE